MPRLRSKESPSTEYDSQIQKARREHARMRDEQFGDSERYQTALERITQLLIQVDSNQSIEISFPKAHSSELFRIFSNCNDVRISFVGNRLEITREGWEYLITQMNFEIVQLHHQMVEGIATTKGQAYSIELPTARQALVGLLLASTFDFLPIAPDSNEVVLEAFVRTFQGQDILCKVTFIQMGPKMSPRLRFTKVVTGTELQQVRRDIAQMPPVPLSLEADSTGTPSEARCIEQMSESELESLATVELTQLLDVIKTVSTRHFLTAVRLEAVQYPVLAGLVRRYITNWRVPQNMYGFSINKEDDCYTLDTRNPNSVTAETINIFIVRLISDF